MESKGRLQGDEVVFVKSDFNTDKRMLKMVDRRDIGISTQCVATECWERKGDAIVDEANRRTAVDFISELKNQNAAAWVAVKTFIVKPVFNEVAIKRIINEKRFEEDEVFGAFVERLIVKGKLNKIENPEKVVPFLQQCLRRQITKSISGKEKKRANRIVYIDDLFSLGCNIDIEDDFNRADLIAENETLIAVKNLRLNEDEKAIVRKCFTDLWKSHPKYAYVVALRNDGLLDREINELIAVGTNGYVAKLAQRGYEHLQKYMLNRTKNIEIPGVPSKCTLSQGRDIHE